MLACKGKCVHCQEKLIKVEYDHRLSDAICKKHGIKSNDISNCDPLCRSCHKKKTRDDMFEIAKVNRQDKRYGERRTGRAKASLPTGRKIQSAGFQKKPGNYNSWKRKFE